MFEEDHPQSPTEPAPQKKRVGTAVMLAAGGVVVATLFATVASMLAASGQEANPERRSADVVETITSVAPDGSTSTVVVTVPSSTAASSAKPDRKQAARPNEQPKPDAPVQQPQVTTNPGEPSQPQSNPPTSWTEPTTSSTSSTSQTTAPPSSSASSSSAVPDPKP
ncbi:hypothetical protein C8D88_102467 [Lentzea atacamensis]|uniref:Uncharacterized protein n=1 Tax=Lentzea atacamensis TaxID=531938 RepID=A0A316I9W3_9PSEU|nr:hypothetical protein [Lentzea atacamensis]PWK89196.1 hypothetical protein C8D88_102467 [Lentzea atacamensis]RAS61916.1 hypothetical protein C8D87_109363 [Lentzea atacamensis]